MPLASGYVIGGLSGGEAKKDFFRTARQSCDVLTAGNPRYVMGQGNPLFLF